MDDEAMQSVINRIDRLDNRLKEVENQSSGWVAKIGRIGIIVGCIGGILGGVYTCLSLWKWATTAPNFSLEYAPVLQLYWISKDQRLSHTWGVAMINIGEAPGSITAAR